MLYIIYSSTFLSFCQFCPLTLNLLSSYTISKLLLPPLSFLLFLILLLIEHCLTLYFCSLWFWLHYFGFTFPNSFYSSLISLISSILNTWFWHELFAWWLCFGVEHCWIFYFFRVIRREGLFFYYFRFNDIYCYELRLFRKKFRFFKDDDRAVLHVFILDLYFYFYLCIYFYIYISFYS